MKLLQAKLWRTTVNAQTNEADWVLDSTLSEFKSAVTAVAFAPVCSTYFLESVTFMLTFLFRKYSRLVAVRLFVGRWS
jgi:hypothetical protein